MNFLGVTLEAAARSIGADPTYQNLEVGFFFNDKSKLMKSTMISPLTKQRSLLTPRWRRRFYSLLGAPLNMMSILSQFYFLMGKEAGDMVAARACQSWPIGKYEFTCGHICISKVYSTVFFPPSCFYAGTPVILLFMYCSAQTSFEMRNWDVRNLLLEKKSN